MGANQSKTYRAEDIVWGHFKTHQGVAGGGGVLFITYIKERWEENPFEKGGTCLSPLRLK